MRQHAHLDCSDQPVSATTGRAEHSFCLHNAGQDGCNRLSQHDVICPPDLCLTGQQPGKTGKRPKHRLSWRRSAAKQAQITTAARISGRKEVGTTSWNRQPLARQTAAQISLWLSASANLSDRLVTSGILSIWSAFLTADMLYPLNKNNCQACAWRPA